MLLLFGYKKYLLRWMAAGLGFFVDFIVVVNVVWFLILETFTSSDLADSRGEGKNESQPTASS